MDRCHLKFPLRLLGSWNHSCCLWNSFDHCNFSTFSYGFSMAFWLCTGQLNCLLFLPLAYLYWLQMQSLFVSSMDYRFSPANSYISQFFHRNISSLFILIRCLVYRRVFALLGGGNVAERLRKPSIFFFSAPPLFLSYWFFAIERYIDEVVHLMFVFWNSLAL